MNKKLKKSKRGLTFSFESTRNFQVGNHFVYDIKGNKIIITPSEEGNTISKKRSGKKIKSLIDIRKKSVVDKVKAADYMDITILEDKIIITLCKKAKNNILQFRKALKTYVMPKELLMASGCENQISIDQWLSNYESIFTNPSINESVTKQTLHTGIKVLSVFSGCGMLDFPAYKSGFCDIVLASDINDAAMQTYRNNMDIPTKVCDIKNLSAPEEPIDLMIGGPSCKSFSNANRRTRLADHPDYFLYKEYIRLINEATPKIFVMENVVEFLSCTQFLEDIKQCLPNYEITTNIVKDHEVGGYTTRERVFLIGSRIGKITLPKFRETKFKTVREAFSKIDSSWFHVNEIVKSSDLTKKRMRYVQDGSNWKDIPKELQTKSKHDNMYRRLSMDTTAHALVNFRKVVTLPPREIAVDRIISLAEASALSGIGNYKFSGTKDEKIQQVANGVPYRMAKFVIDNVLKHLKPRISYSI